jgi:hypothetical protein
VTVLESVVYNLDEREYHAHPALSSSGARKLLPPSCPAVFDWERRNPPESRSVFDIGSAAHKLVLGAGLPIRVIDAPDWRTKAAKEQRDAARECDEIPVLTHEYERVRGMADALCLHPVAEQLFSAGTPELSLFWRDDRSGVECRARLDWLGTNVLGDPVIVDYKTCASADPRSLARAVQSYGYHVQASWYMEGAQATGVAPEAGFLFVCQEKTPPYPVTVLALDREALRVGKAKARHARSIYAKCLAKDEWPAYSDGIVDVGLPVWAQDEEAA